jgi:hypothetical protein
METKCNVRPYFVIWPTTVSLYTYTQREKLLSGGWMCVHHERYQNTVKRRSVIVVNYAHTRILLKGNIPCKTSNPCHIMSHDSTPCPCFQVRSLSWMWIGGIVCHIVITNIIFCMFNLWGNKQPSTQLCLCHFIAMCFAFCGKPLSM